MRRENFKKLIDEIRSFNRKYSKPRLPIAAEVVEWVDASPPEALVTKVKMYNPDPLANFRWVCSKDILFIDESKDYVEVTCFSCGKRNFLIHQLTPGFGAEVCSNCNVMNWSALGVKEQI